jgi:hypothetical protein
MSLQSRRQGFALAVALAAIVIIGGLIAGVFYASTQEYRIGRNTILQTRALATAEYGISYLLMGADTNQWSSTWNANPTPGLLATKVYTVSSGAIDTVRVFNLTNGNFLVTSEGRIGTGTGAQARRRVGALVTLAVPQIKVLGALTTRGSTKIGGSSYIDGNDNPIPNWDCPPADTALPGITTNDPTDITLSGCKDLSCIDGNPKVQPSEDAGSDSTYTQFGDINWDQFTALAQKVYPAGANLSGMGPVYSGTTCDQSVLSNWGDPKRTDGKGYCAGYYPIIYAQGDLHVTGGVGQGILLVEGSLVVSGGFEFYGPVIVKGNLQTTGTGGHFNGGVMAENVDFEQNTVLGNAVVNYSKCALTNAVNGSARASLSNGRSWMDLP